MTAIKQKKEKGFTLLFAVLLAVLVLAVGASVINIAMKQVILTGIGRESQFAFYAANTGVECALYWDYRDLGIFATSSLSDDPTEGIKNLANCANNYNLFSNNEIDNLERNPATPGSAVSKFTIKFQDTIQYCAVVAVTKIKKNDGAIATTIESRGYNTCDEGNPRRIERGLQLSY